VVLGASVLGTSTSVVVSWTSEVLVVAGSLVLDVVPGTVVDT